MSVWQDTPASDLPVEQVFRMVPMSKIDWRETMQRSEVLDAIELQAIRDTWNTIASSNKERLPKGVRKSLELGLSLTASVARDETIKSNLPHVAKG